MNKLTSRLMNTPADFDKFGVKPNTIEEWEDGRRDDSRPGAFEWWYFDMLLDDGTKVVAIFQDKEPSTPAIPMNPVIRFEVTLPTGEHFHEYYAVPAEDCTFSRETCDIRMGDLHSLTGNLKKYEIKISPEATIGANLVLESMSSPWRPGSGYIGFGEDDKDYFTWLCSIPRGRVHGQLTVNGETKDVTGFGYHDHQWGNVPALMVWNHWFWIRQAFDDYTILVFDMIANENYGFKRYPLVFVQDADGQVIFESTGDIDETNFQVNSEYVQDATGKQVPDDFTYTFRDGDKTLVYSMKVKQELVAEDNYSMVPPDVRALFDQAKIKPSYTRWVGQGQLEIDVNDSKVQRQGDAIYEMVFPGTKYQNY